ncbi:MAG: sulfate adenylyltransferase subunit CysN [Lentisphaeraceae bacterium]|nr:sulfate adenylyltransferase subunit CysN [Lentisphaeraceae bacterium]
MSHQSELIEKDILGYLKEHENKELLRFLTCGSVDDGKSTLIGRLLHDSKLIYEDQLSSIKKDSKKFNTTDEEFDLALLVDGLEDERQQGITIDVAYRYFSTSKRKFIIADTPGHEQYTRNMATGASNCQLAIILLDARKGVLPQTKRHSFIAHLLGIKHIVVAINKMDLVDFSEDVYNETIKGYNELAKTIGIEEVHYLPLSALKGDNVVDRSSKTDWYDGPTLMELLNTVELTHDRNYENFRMPVQYVVRPNLDFRGFCGTISGGEVKVGDEIVTLPSGKESKVKSIVTYDGELQEACAGMAVTLTLEDEIDSSRGDLIVKKGDEATSTDSLQAHIVWMHEEKFETGRLYDFKFASKSVSGQLISVDYKYDINTLDKISTDHFELNEIGLCRIDVTDKVSVDPYSLVPGTGAFVVIDRLSNVTIGAGIVSKALSSTDGSAVAAGPSFEVELNALIRKHFPAWECKDISQILK